MKQLVTLLAVGVLGFAGYKYHQNQLNAYAAQPSAEKLKAIALSRVIEPYYKDLFSPLDQNRPADLVPPLEITRERILDVKTHAEPEKLPVYAQGITLLEAMIVVAEERTKALESLVRAINGKSSLDSPTATSTSSAFFAQTVKKRWEDEKNRRKSQLDQLFTQLRNAEREWNKRAGKDAREEKYNLPPNVPVYVNIDAPVTTSNPLERRAYDRRRVNSYSWRQSYYDRYGSQ